MELHTRECIHNPIIRDRRDREEADHHEDREAERERRRKAEAREEARLDQLEQERKEDRAAKLRREAAAEEAEENKRAAESARLEEEHRQRLGRAPTTVTGAHRSGPRPPARDRPKLETEMSPEDFELFKMQWQSYRDTTLVPNLYTAEGISMELWQCCGNTLQGNLINNSMANTSSETELLSKLKDITVKAPSYLVNRLNFMEMKQGATETSQQWLSRLKGKAQHCNFNVPTGQTSYMDQRVKDTFILGLHDASIKSDIMEESALSEA